MKQEKPGRKRKKGGKEVPVKIVIVKSPKFLGGLLRRIFKMKD